VINSLAATEFLSQNSNNQIYCIYNLKIHWSNHSSCMLVCNWPHSVGQNHFFVMMLFNRDSAIQTTSRRICTIYKLENLVPCQQSGRCDIPSRTPNYPKHHSSGWRELSVRTFFCVEKLQIAPACIRPNVSTARLDDSQCSTSFRISFQNIVMGSSLQPSWRSGFPSGRAHP